MLAERSQQAHTLLRIRRHEVHRPNWLLPYSKGDNLFKRFFSFSVLALFVHTSDVTRAVSQLLACFLLVAAVSSLDSHFEEHRNKSKAESWRHICCHEQVPLCAGDGCSFRSASRHEEKSESIYQQCCRVPLSAPCVKKRCCPAHKMLATVKSERRLQKCRNSCQCTTFEGVASAHETPQNTRKKMLSAKSVLEVYSAYVPIAPFWCCFLFLQGHTAERWCVDRISSILQDECNQYVL